MEETIINTANFGLFAVAAAFAFAAIGSALGTGIAGQSAIGAWKKCYANGKSAPFMLMAFVGAPLSQTFYGLILMNRIAGADLAVIDPWQLLGVGILGGLGMGFSAYLQGKAGAAACDAFAETGKGFTNYLLVLGIVETVALLVMVFLLGKV
ncbi:MAG: V-type ATP synthase subunit K [Spirochaetales bacterium]|nr:V-type ATP synthase subunit K [Spirochaetales bacterium]